MNVIPNGQIEALYCKQCREKLTHRTLQHGDATKVNLHSEKPIVKEGEYLFTKELDYEFPVRITHFVDMDSMLLVDHVESRRMLGCCGPGFSENYNQVCWKCQFEIGILNSDCMGLHFLAINADRLTTTPLR